MQFTVRLKCDRGHYDDVMLAGVSREEAELFCGLMDGTSELFVRRPKPGEPYLPGSLGHCLCGGTFTAFIVDQQSEQPA